MKKILILFFACILASCTNNQNKPHNNPNKASNNDLNDFGLKGQVKFCATYEFDAKQEFGSMHETKARECLTLTLDEKGFLEDMSYQTERDALSFKFRRDKDNFEVQKDTYSDTTFSFRNIQRYHGNHCIDEDSAYNADGEFLQKEEFSYNENNQIVGYVKYNKNNGIILRRSDYVYSDGLLSQYKEYDSDGNLNTAVSYKYDEKGRVIREIREDDARLIEVITKEYNDYDDYTYLITDRGKSRTIEKVSYQYDSHGNAVREEKAITENGVTTYKVVKNFYEYYGESREFNTSDLPVLARIYNITFVDYDGTVLQSLQIEEDEMPRYSGNTPVKAGNDEYVYQFSGWSPSITKAEKDAKYTAQYKTSIAPPQPLEAIDLGLPSRTKWANKNLGARRIYDYGDYYAWGEVYSKSSYLESNYKYRGSASYEFTKYYYYPKGDKKTTLERSDDAAYRKLGGSWQIPSKAQFEELIRYCKIEQFSIMGLRLYRITGPNGKSIILPGAGQCEGTTREYTFGIYWTSSLDKPDLCAWSAHFYSDKSELNSDMRYIGMPIRPVCK